MLYIKAFSSVSSIYCWDLSFFDKPELKDDQARFLNFLDAQALIDSFSMFALSEIFDNAVLYD